MNKLRKAFCVISGISSKAYIPLLWGVLWAYFTIYIYIYRGEQTIYFAKDLVILMMLISLLIFN